MKDPETRFSDGAESYAKYRPGYPGETLEFLADKCALTGGSVVADVGSGAGLLSKLFLGNGNRVLAVEPNGEMRRAAEGALGDHPRFESVAGAAEDTTLAAGSVDLIAVANSLHWVEVEAARAEFSRVLKPGGRVAVVWNIPRSSGTPFPEALGRIVSAYRTDGGAGGDAEDVYGMTGKFFYGGSASRRGHEMGSSPYYLSLDLEGLRGPQLSYPSMPAGDEAGAEEMLRELEGVFSAHRSEGKVVVEYRTSVYCGRLG